MRRLPSIAVGLLLVVTVLATVTGCARDWPDDFPPAYAWQQRSAPLDLLDGQPAGSSYAVSAYARSRPDPPVSEQQRYQDHQRLPTRLDVVCIDDDGDDFGRLGVSMRLSRPVLEIWHPRQWERWHLEFSSPQGKAEISVNLAEERSDDREKLDSGFIPYLHSPDLVNAAIDNFRNYAGTDGAVMRVRADFPSTEGKPPLEWEFDLGPDSRAEELLSSLVENCGDVW